MQLSGDVQSMLPASAIQRILRRAGGTRLSRQAVEALRDALESYALHVARRAVRLAQHARRKIVTKEDVRLAAKP